MKKEEEIFEKCERLKTARLAKRRADYLSQSCQNCVFNDRVRVKQNGKIGFCTNKDVLNGKQIYVCNEDNTAKKCPHFECKNTKESVEKDFNDILKSPPRCGNEYPKLAILLWFLQNSDFHYKTKNRLDRFIASCRRLLDGARDLINFRWW